MSSSGIWGLSEPLLSPSTTSLGSPDGDHCPWCKVRSLWFTFLTNTNTYKYLNSTQLCSFDKNADFRRHSQIQRSNRFLIFGIVHFNMKAVKILTLLTSLIKCQSNVNHTDELRFSLESFQIKLLSTAFTSFLNSDLSSFSLRQIITIKAWKRRGEAGHKYLVLTFDIKTLNLNPNQGRSCQEDAVDVVQQTAGPRDACHE